MTSDTNSEIAEMDECFELLQAFRGIDDATLRAVIVKVVQRVAASRTANHTALQSPKPSTSNVDD